MLEKHALSKAHAAPGCCFIEIDGDGKVKVLSNCSF
jgi:hypothetical protein